MKRLFASLAITFVLVFSFVGSVSAHTARPSTANCNSGCNGYLLWPGTTYGAYSRIYVPSFTGGSAYSLERVTDVVDTVNSNEIAVGYCFGTNQVGGHSECDNNNGEYFFSECQPGRNTCAVIDLGAIPAADKGHTADFALIDDWHCIGASNASCSIRQYDILIRHQGNGTDRCPFTVDSFGGTPCFANSPGGTRGTGIYSSFNFIQPENFTSGSFTGTRQGTFTYVNNEWAQEGTVSGCGIGITECWGVGNFVYDAVDPQVNGINGAQLYILVHPNGSSNTGGQMQGCNEDRGNNTCI